MSKRRKPDSQIVPKNSIIMAIFTHGSCDIHPDSANEPSTPLYTIPENMHITRYSMPFGTINFMQADFAKEMYNTVKYNVPDIMDGNVNSLLGLIEINATATFNEMQEMKYNLMSAKYDYRQAKTEKTRKEVEKFADEVRERRLYADKAMKSYSTPKKFGPYQQILNKTFIVNPKENKEYGVDANSITGFTREGEEINVIPYRGADGNIVYKTSLSDALLYLSSFGYNDIIILDYSCSEIYVDGTVRPSHKEKYSMRKKVYKTAKKHGGRRRYSRKNIYPKG